MCSVSTPFSMLINQPSKPWCAAMAASCAATASAAAAVPNSWRQATAPASHSVINVPRTGTPWVWATFTQPTGGMVTRRWLRQARARERRQE